MATETAVVIRFIAKGAKDVDKEISTVLESMRKQGVQAKHEILSLTETTSRSHKRMQAEVARTERAYFQLASSLDPAIERTFKMEKAQQTLDRAMKAGIITQAEHNRLLAMAAKEYSNTGGKVDALGGAMGRLGTAVAAVASAWVTRHLVEYGKAAIQTQTEVERLKRTLTGDEFKFLEQESERLGLALNSVSRQYIQLAAASKGSALEGKATESVFTGLSEAAIALGLSQHQLELSIFAVTQMISKSRVSQEELRRQLAENLPGAIQIAARAMGVTTAELDKMIERGEVLAEDLIPKLGAQLHKEFGGRAAIGSQQLQSELNRLSTALWHTRAAVAEGLSPAVIEMSKGMQEWVRDNRDVASSFGEDLGGALRLVIGGAQLAAKHLTELKIALELAIAIHVAQVASEWAVSLSKMAGMTQEAAVAFVGLRTAVLGWSVAAAAGLLLLNEWVEAQTKANQRAIEEDVSASKLTGTLHELWRAMRDGGIDVTSLREELAGLIGRQDELKEKAAAFKDERLIPAETKTQLEEVAERIREVQRLLDLPGAGMKALEVLKQQLAEAEAAMKRLEAAQPKGAQPTFGPSGVITGFAPVPESAALVEARRLVAELTRQIEQYQGAVEEADAAVKGATGLTKTPVPPEGFAELTARLREQIDAQKELIAGWQESKTAGQLANVEARALNSTLSQAKKFTGDYRKTVFDLNAELERLTEVAKAVKAERLAEIKVAELKQELEVQKSIAEELDRTLQLENTINEVIDRRARHAEEYPFPQIDESILGDSSDLVTDEWLRGANKTNRLWEELSRRAKEGGADAGAAFVDAFGAALEGGAENWARVLQNLAKIASQIATSMGASAAGRGDTAGAENYSQLASTISTYAQYIAIIYAVYDTLDKYMSSKHRATDADQVRLEVSASLDAAFSILNNISGQASRLGEEFTGALNDLVDSLGDFVDILSLPDFQLRVSDEGAVSTAIDGVWRTFGTDLNYAIQESLVAILSRAEFAGLDPRVEEVLRASMGRTFEELQEAIALAVEVLSFGKSDTTRGLDALFTHFKNLADQAIELGLSSEWLGKIWGEYAAQLAQRAEELQARADRLGGTGRGAFTTSVLDQLRDWEDLISEARDTNQHIADITGDANARLQEALTSQAALVATIADLQAQLEAVQPGDAQSDQLIADLQAQLTTAQLSLEAIRDAISRYQAILAGAGDTVDVDALIAQRNRAMREAFQNFISGFMDIGLSSFEIEARDTAKQFEDARQALREATDAGIDLGITMDEIAAAERRYQEDLSNRIQVSVLDRMAQYTQDQQVLLRLQQLKGQMEYAQLMADIALLEKLGFLTESEVAWLRATAEDLRDEITGFRPQPKPGGPGGGDDDETPKPGGGGGGRKDAREDLWKRLQDAIQGPLAGYTKQMEDIIRLRKEEEAEAKKLGISIEEVIKADEARRKRLKAEIEQDIQQKLSPTTSTGKEILDLQKWAAELRELAPKLGLSLADIEAALKAGMQRIVDQVMLSVREFANVYGQDDLGIALLQNQMQAAELRQQLEELAKAGVDVTEQLRLLDLAEKQRAALLRLQAKAGFLEGLADFVTDEADRIWLLNNAARLKYNMELAMLRAQFEMLVAMNAFPPEMETRIREILEGIPGWAPDWGGDGDGDGGGGTKKPDRAQIARDVRNVFDPTGGFRNQWRDFNDQVRDLEASLRAAGLPTDELDALLRRLGIDAAKAKEQMAAEETAGLYEGIAAYMADSVEKQQFLAKAQQIQYAIEKAQLRARLEFLRAENAIQTDTYEELKAALESLPDLFPADYTEDIFGIMEGIAGYMEDGAEKEALLKQIAEARYDIEIATMRTRLEFLYAENAITTEKYQQLLALLDSLPEDLPPWLSGGGTGGTTGGSGNPAQDMYDLFYRLQADLQEMITASEGATGWAAEFAALDAEFERIRTQIETLPPSFQAILDPLFDAAYEARWRALWERLLQPLEDWIGSLDISPLSPLPIEQQIATARSQLEATYAAAMAGDPDAAAAFLEQAQAYLELAQQYGTATPIYGQIYAWVQQMAQGILGLGATGGGAFPSTPGLPPGLPALPGLPGLPGSPLPGSPALDLAAVFGGNSGTIFAGAASQSDAIIASTRAAADAIAQFARQNHDDLAAILRQLQRRSPGSDEAGYALARFSAASSRSGIVVEGRRGKITIGVGDN